MNETSSVEEDNYWKNLHNDTINSILQQALELGFSNIPEEEKNKLIKK